MPANPFQSLMARQRRDYAAALELCRSQLSGVDEIVAGAVEAELQRQSTINLIASESRPSMPVMAASSYLGYTQTVEGMPGRRWYPGGEAVDTIEADAITRAKSLFHFPAANLQAHSATQANQGVYLSALKPGDTILSPAFTSGGHLSHGAKLSLANRFYKIETYGVPSFDAPFDPEHLKQRIKQVRPALIIAGASAYPREFPYAEIAALAKANSSLLLADISHTAGLVAAGIHRPVGDADFCTLSTHKTMLGPRAGVILCRSDYKQRIDKAIFPGIQGAVFPNMMAAKAVCLAVAATSAFKGIQAAIVENAQAFAGIFADAKIPMFTGGTDSHLLLIRKKSGLDARADVARLERIGILTNANYTHGDSLSRGEMSGIRLGVPRQHP